MNYNDLLRNDFNSFCQKIVPRFQVSWHHRIIAAHLQAVERGEIKRLIISEPPRHGKTMQIGELFPAWYLGRNSHRSLIYTTYGQNLASRVGRKVREHMLHRDYTKIFPNAVLSKDSKAKHHFAISGGGEYNAVGRGGPMTGKGGSILLADDMFKDHKEAFSKTIRENSKDWWRSTFSTRVEPDGAIILFGTRWHKDDLMGWVPDEYKDYPWHILNLPAILDVEDDYDPRKVGEALWPERFSVDDLLKIKNTKESLYFWNALYQGRPSQLEGNILIRDKWSYYDELPNKFDDMVMFWDLSFAEGEEHSFVVGQIWGRHRQKYYLIHQYRKQAGFTEQRAAFVRMCQMFPQVYKRIVERAANASALSSSLENVIAGIETRPPDGSKTARAMSIAHLQNNGALCLPNPDREPWIKEYIERASDFPRCDYDDEIDCTSGAVKELYDSSLTSIESLLVY